MDLGTSATQEPGVVDASASPGAVEDAACVGAGAFKQYAPGRAVTILDNGGEVIGSGELQVGTIIPVGAASGCRLPFTIADVPLVASYTFDVGTATLSYSQERLDADDWSVELEIRSGG